MGGPHSDKNNNNEALSPPPYSTTSDKGGLSANYPTTNNRAANRSPARSIPGISDEDDEFAFLSKYDTIFVIDDSGSMRGSSWVEVKQVLQQITPICTKHDKDGIDLYFLNHFTADDPGNGKARGGYYNINSEERVEEIFKTVGPTYMTDTEARLRDILEPYMTAYAHASDKESVKPVNIIVITDGVPTDNPKNAIVEYARRLDQLNAPFHQ
ncbi:hypothetical protein S40288_09995, partial [Stachybotrys chartarum IBT 40288]